MEIELSGLYAVGVEKIDSIFQAGNTVWDLGEVAQAHGLLSCKIKWGMVRADGVHKSLSQAVPKHFLIFLSAQRRGHYILRPFEVRSLRIGLVEQQILNKRLNPNPDAAKAGANRFFKGFVAAQVHDVDGSAGHLGERHEMVHAFGFNARRPALVMTFRASDTLGEKPALRRRDKSLVLAMSCGYHAKFPREPESLK